MTTSSLRFALVLMCTTGFLDAYTYISRGGVFANAQTGNVILGAVDLSSGHWSDALRHLWPILAFACGVAIAAWLSAEVDQQYVPVSAPATLALGVVVLTVVSTVPASAPPTLVIVPITVVSAMQMELFRHVGDLVYAPIATTGNLMRLVESGHAHLRIRDETSRRTFGVYLGIFGAFGVGAVSGAVATDLTGVRATLIPAAVLAIGLVAVLSTRRRSAPTTAS